MNMLKKEETSLHFKKERSFTSSRNMITVGSRVSWKMEQVASFQEIMWKFVCDDRQKHLLLA